METISIYRTIEKQVKVSDLLKTTNIRMGGTLCTQIKYEEIFNLVRKLVRENRNELFGTCAPYRMITNGYKEIKRFEIEGKKNISGKAVVEKLVKILKDKK